MKLRNKSSDESKRKVIINGRFLSKQITGVQRCAIEIVKELDALNPDNYEILVPKQIYDSYALNYKNIKIIRSKSILSGNLWDHIVFSHYVRKENALNVNLCNGFIVHKPSIITVHDVKYRSNAEFYTETISDLLRLVWNRFSLFMTFYHSSRIVTVSEFSRDEILKYYRIGTDQISVVYNAWQHLIPKNHNEQEIMKKYPFLNSGRYYFSMSSLEKNKNYKWLLFAAKNNPEYTFAIAGGGNLKGAAEAANFKNLPNIYFLGYVPDEDAKVLMKNCKAFVFPSLYEGFGMTPLEAVANGAKVLMLSDIPVFHEIYGKHAIYFDPLDYKYIFDESALDCDFKFEQLLEKYSWKRSAKQYYDLIESERQK